MTRDTSIVCFGEVMLRLSAIGSELLLQSPKLDVHFGGAEANVAVLIARLGGTSRLVSFLPDNRLGQAALEELRRYGVDTKFVATAPGRMGIYFLSPGAVLRPSEVLYDREHSAFARAPVDAVDWTAALAGAGTLHISGVTPAIGHQGAQAALRAAKAAVELNIPVSFDGNYRGKLWAAWGGDGPGILRQLFAQTSIAFADDRDVALVLGQRFDHADPIERRRQAAEAAFAAFPRLTHITSTIRVQHGVDYHDMSAVLFTRSGLVQTGTSSLAGIVDRIGAGDAFAGGVLYGLSRGFDERKALDYGLAAACLKHGVPGDFCLTNLAEVESRVAGDGLDVRR